MLHQKSDKHQGKQYYQVTNDAEESGDDEFDIVISICQKNQFRCHDS